MIDPASELEDEDFFIESIEQIAMEFKIPRSTAYRWDNEFSNLDMLAESVGKNGPQNYLDIVRRREWIPHEQDQRMEELIYPLKRWCASRADGVILYHRSDPEDTRTHPETTGTEIPVGNGWTVGAEGERSSVEFVDNGGIGNLPRSVESLKEEIDTKEEWVKSEIQRLDRRWIGLARELNSIENELSDIYLSHIGTTPRSLDTKKEKIVELKTEFPYLRTSNDLLARVIGTSPGYSKRFKQVPGSGIADREASKELRNAVLKRDSHSCVVCGSAGEIQVHHIIPRNEGGENTEGNLATLCSACHYYSHGGGNPDHGRNSSASWQSVEYDSQEEFWNSWIDKDFAERENNCEGQELSSA